LKSSITASFYLSAEISTILIGVVYLISGIGNALSMKIFTTLPSCPPTKRLSLLVGPLIGFTYLIAVSKTHSLSRTPVKARS
jgi:hypothetical protein